MSNNKIRFGPFELDVKAGELRRGGRRVRLQEKPLKMLQALVEQPGEVMSRDELRARLWPATMVVDFDNGLNNAAQQASGSSRRSRRTPRATSKRGPPRLPFHRRARRNDAGCGAGGDTGDTLLLRR